MPKKKKKKILKKVNPEKSNKMIYAVGIGLFIVFVLFFYFIAKSGPETLDKSKALNQSIEYLKHIDGIKKVDIDEKNFIVSIIYDELFDKDFKKILNFASIRVSNIVKNQIITFRLYKNKSNDLVYEIKAKNGSIL